MTSTSSTQEMGLRFAASSIGSIVAETLTLPTDVAKTRMQVQTTPARYKSFVHCVSTIKSEEGVAALWKGLAPALVRQVCYSGLSMVLFEPVRNMYSSFFRSKEPSFQERLLAGGTSGALAITVFNPTEVLKTQIMTSKTPQTITGVVRRVYKNQGIIGFWAGLGPNISRTFLVNAAELGTYDQAKQTLQPYVGDGFLNFLGASTIAAVASASVSTPADVVKTRMMNMSGNLTAKQYSGMIDGFIQIVRTEGVMALYKGFSPILVRKVMWCSAFFPIYEMTRSGMREWMF
jgi:hypothetical protein